MHFVETAALVLLASHFVLGHDDLVMPVRSKRAVGNSIKDNNLNGHVEKGYYVEIFIGTPAQSLDILIDTGSSNFAVASEPNPFVTKYYHGANSSTRLDLGIADADIEYTEGFWKGHLISDLVSVPDSGLNTSVRVDIAEITSSDQFFINGSGWQGILGLAYDQLVRPENSEIRSFVGKVVETVGIKDSFSIQLCMAKVETLDDSTGGTLKFGASSILSDDQNVYWTNVVREWYYEVVVIGMKVGDVKVPVSCSEFNNDKTIVDSGTTNLHLPGHVFGNVLKLFKSYVMKTIPGYEIKNDFWSGESVLCWTEENKPYDLFPNITISLPSSTGEAASFSLVLHPRHYLLFYGKDQEYDINRKICYKFGITASSTGTVLGVVLMEQYVVIFDRENRRVGFTESDCSQTSELSYMLGYPNTTSCAFIESHKPIGAMHIVMYVLLGILLLCMMPVCVLSYIWCCRNEKTPLVNDASMLLDSPSNE